MIPAAAVGVYWNEAHRIGPLMQSLVDNFDEVVVVVQESTDDTLRICRSILTGPKHKVIEDGWRGGGDFSMPLALSHVTNEWTFVISGDETIDDDLLRTLPDAIDVCDKGGYNGAFVDFTESIEGVEYVEHERHVRLFRTATGWEARHHSAATHENVIAWPFGKIIHTRTLEEVCRDYLRKLTMMEQEGDERLALHNRYTIFNVCNLVADVKGWRFVWSLEQWPEIERRVFSLAAPPIEVI